MRRLILAAALTLAACGSAGSGGAPSPSPTPKTADDVLARFDHSNMRDGHAAVVLTISNAGQNIDLKGDGNVVVEPDKKLHLRAETNFEGQVIFIEVTAIGETTYTRGGAASDPSTQKWEKKVDTAKPGTKSEYVLSFTKKDKAIPEESLPQGKCWHVKGENKSGPTEAWIRESDGYLVKAVSSSSGQGTLTLDFDKFNTGAQVAAPPASDIK